ncbi:hypothetical protein PIB30_012757 [Stylosanthes scabra]|uniref:photosystem I n=1 Tax=Stylosanthes scabra TaxID=79078 RepID=A0ABU6S6I2_9FABA|nr:hypothetical protein [Stylosanthes scabra]
MSALGRPQDMFSDTAIQLQPVFAQWIQNTHALAPNTTAPGATTSTSLTWGGGDLVAVGGKVALLPIPLGTSDFLVHHIHAFTIHVTVLILLKGVLFARSSRLIPDKANLGFRFPCDGPGRGGTCQVSAWDHVFLGLFWMYNAISVVIFHFSWKMQSDVWGTISDQGVVTHITGGNFAQSSITINGWLRDFLWAQASQMTSLLRKKGKGKEKAQSSEAPRFKSPFHEAHFKGKLSARKVLSEVPIDLNDDILSPCAIQIRMKKWEKFTAPLQAVGHNLVKEFYANAWEPDKSKRKPYTYTTMVQGTDISFAPRDIKRVLKLKRREWVLHKDGRPHYLRRNDLEPMAKGWYDFVYRSIFPITNRSELTVEKVVLIHSIIIEENINVEEIIAEQFYKFIYKTDLSSSLPFPSIIAALYLDAKVTTLKDDTLINQELPIVGEALIRTRE